MLFSHYSLVPWDHKRWPNFSPAEPHLSCPCCGSFFYDPIALDKLQGLRNRLKKPIHINSGHRCPFHNAKVGGAPLSMHKRQIAFDVSLKNQNPADLLKAAREIGFHGFGFYATFLHLDLGRFRWWITKGGLITWRGLR